MNRTDSSIKAASHATTKAHQMSEAIANLQTVTEHLDYLIVQVKEEDGSREDAKDSPEPPALNTALSALLASGPEVLQELAHEQHKRIEELEELLINV